MSDQRLKRCSTRHGFALFLVLWVLMFLSVVVGQFCYAMRTELNIAANFKEESQAYYTARAGLCQGLKMVIENERRPHDLARLREDETLVEDEGEMSQGLRLDVELPSEPFGRGRYVLKIGNESGKVNINQAGDELLRMLLDAFDLEDSDKDVIVDSIQDWRDEDDLHRVNGAESDYYQGMRPPYDAKNGPFDSIDELLLVKGVTPELFYGGLKDLVTVYPLDQGGTQPRRGPMRIASMRFGARRGGSGININAASPQMLRALPEMTPELVEAILEYRKDGNFLAESDIVAVVGPDVYRAIQPYVSTQLNPYYTITAGGLLPDSLVRQTVEMLVEVNPAYPKQYRIVRWIDGK